MTPTFAPIRERDGRGNPVVGASPNQPTQSTVQTTPRSPSIPPSGGDSSAHTRSAAARVAPAPIRALVSMSVLGAAFFGIHAAASHPISAVVTAAALLTITALTARR